MTLPETTGARPNPARGTFVVVEGIDGTGKSTLVRELAEALRARGRTVVTSAEPTRGPFGMKLRALASEGREHVTPEQESELFMSDRREHLETLIRPALARGETVILDRYYYSTLAYQGARGVDRNWILERHAQFAPEPDLLVILDLPVEEALRRITHKRGDQPNAYEGAEYLARVREIFQTLRHPNLLRLDARQSCAQMVGAIVERLA
jgi:dTMP kinase